MNYSLATHFGANVDKHLEEMKTAKVWDVIFKGVLMRPTENFNRITSIYAGRRNLAQAITSMAKELEHDESELLWLLLENMPINSLMTHSYGFHTANGRHIIETIKQKYYEYESAS